MTPREFILIRKSLQIVIASASNLIERYGSEARKSPPPRNLRTATPHDIVEGALIWYKPDSKDHYWQIVKEVLQPNDWWKAYFGEDGCRYGLDGAWVEMVD